MNVLITGAKGFVGSNLCWALRSIRDGYDTRPQFANLLPLTIFEYDLDSTSDQLDKWCSQADFVFNLAGVNRPEDPSEFLTGNFGFASVLLDTLKRHGNACPVMLSSSVQASLEGRFAGSEYGKSKYEGEQLFRRYSELTGAKVLIYRFPNLFGKWCRPNYNSVIATFCNNIANDLPITVNNPLTELELLYIDDLVTEMLNALIGNETSVDAWGEKDGFCHAGPTDIATLGEIVELLEGFHAARNHISIADVTKGSLSQKLYSTYQSYLDPIDFSYELSSHVDVRGSFTELLHTVDRGQVSINITKPGVTKGQHWHHSKWEKFIVVAGEGLIKERRIGLDIEGNPYPIMNYHVNGEHPTVVDMIPGYTHSITNLSSTADLVTVMWCNEVFDPTNPDTFHMEV